MSVFWDVSSINIKGGIFEEETNLKIYENTKNKSRFCLIYGKNGTGKSTISRAFNKLRGEEEPTIDKAEFLDKDGNVLTMGETDKKSIYVFNEDFIDHNIKIEKDGLNAIIVMGAKKDIDDKIKKLTPEFLKSKENYEKQCVKCSKYDDSKNLISPSYYEKEMMNSLKGDTGWAGRDARIKGNTRRNSSVSRETYKKFVNLNTTKTRDELIIEYAQEKKSFEVAKTGSRIISTPVKVSFDFKDIEEDVRKLLAEKIEQPVLSDREKNLFALLKKENGSQHLQNVKEYFTDESHTKCPYCFQEVTKEYATGIVESIEKILSKKVENHKEKLRELKPLTYEYDFTEYKDLNNEYIVDCKEKLQIVNKAVEQIISKILEKISNVYVPITLPSINLKDKYEDFIKSLKQLEIKRKEFNLQATNIEPIVKKLNDINSLIAKYDIEDSYRKFEKYTLEKKNEEATLEVLKNKMQELRKQLDKLEEDKKNVRIAINAINDDLKYIFFSKDRLRIEYKDDKYVLFSHGRPVEPHNVSVGERNAIGLCYFFNRIMENRDELTVHTDPHLLIIDDPVSSFDMENRVGILSYLKYQLNMFALGCKESRFMIMTHDLQTLFDSNKYVEEILAKCANTFCGQNKKCVNILELQDLQVKPSNLLGRHEYTALLEITYDYALNKTQEYSMSIGNIMRKVLEAFGTFTYKKGIAELTTNGDILDELDGAYKKYFENLMYRLVLNGGSHLRDKTQTLNGMNFYDYISEDEKQRTAQDILCLIYQLNPKHIYAHLANRQNVDIQIQNWCKQNIEV